VLSFEFWSILEVPDVIMENQGQEYFNPFIKERVVESSIALFNFTSNLNKSPVFLVAF
jgi:hypothetical protein